MEIFGALRNMSWVYVAHCARGRLNNQQNRFLYVSEALVVSYYILHDYICRLVLNCCDGPFDNENVKYTFKNDNFN